MSSPDFRTFVDGIITSHRAWLNAHPSPTGAEFVDHYLGSASQASGLLWQFEAWRAEHGFVRLRPWDGSEDLGRPASASIPSPGQVLPWNAPTSGGPAIDARLGSGQTTAQLQANFGGSGPAAIAGLGTAIRDHWTAVQGNLSPAGSLDVADPDTAPYSLRFWGFMKWAQTMRSRLLGIPVFAVPIVYDADGVPLTDVEFLDLFNRWHNFWHTGFPPASSVTSQATSNPFAPSHSPFGQLLGRTTSFGGEFFWFHRELLDTYDEWRRRGGMPPVARYRPASLHFHPTVVNGTALPEVQIPTDPAGELAAIKNRTMQFNTLDALAAYIESGVHGAGHTAPGNEDILDVYTNNYSPRFFGWHRWIDYCWEVRQPRLDNFRVVASDGTDYDDVIVVVRPTPAPDRIEPTDAVTGITADGRGSLWIDYQVRPESWGRAINLSISAQVFRNSGDLTPVAGLDATVVTVNAVTQGAPSGPVELVFPGLDGDGDGAFARQNPTASSVGFKNNRIRISVRLTPVGAISGSLAAGPDTIDYETYRDVVLVKDTRPPLVSALLNRSSFSVDEVTVNAAGGATSMFANSFFVIVQDPPEPPPGLGTASIFADPARTSVSGVFQDTAIAPTVEVVDDTGSTVPWFQLALTDVLAEQPGLAPHVSQRILFRYLVFFDPATLSALLPNAGDTLYARLRMRARDRAGNETSNVLSPRIRLFRDANPYMIDIQGNNPGWLSIDTRVFAVRHNEVRFGHSVASSGSPNQYIRDVIGEFNAGTQNFDAIPSQADQARLELAPTVNGQRVYDFTVSRARVRSTTAVNDVRMFFRLFTTAVSNLSFTTQGYPSSNTGNPKALLGRTGTSEIVSIPFFADPRVETRDSVGGVAMTTQTDTPNIQSFPASVGAAESIRYYGAYLDINIDTPRFPQAPLGDGPFPASQCVSIRNILRGQHECMVAELVYAGDPTDPGSNPGTSDNLAQRNLVIMETANPGIMITHRVQHSFDMVLASRTERAQASEEIRLAALQALAELRSALPEPAETPDTPRPPTPMTAASEAEATAAPAWPPLDRTDSLVTQFVEQATRTGLDELALFWNNLPAGAHVEVYLPSLDVDYLMLLRRLRQAPGTVRALDEHTLLLTPAPAAVTFLPFPYLGQERIAGLITITLPDNIKAGQVYTVDVLQVRPATGATVGAFRIAIPVSKAMQLYEPETRLLEVFTERLATTPPDSRWYPILTRQVDNFRDRVQALTAEAVEECRGDHETPRVRVILDRIKVLDTHGPLVQGAGRLSLTARVTSAEGDMISETRLPAAGEIPVPEQPDGTVIYFDTEIFRGPGGDELTVEVWGTDQQDTPHRHYRRTISGASALSGQYRPGDEPRDPEDVGDWQLWYHLEQL
jgi:hypothetical protein